MKNWFEKHLDARSFGDRLADAVAEGMGSWSFIIWQTLFVIVWVAGNIYMLFHFDPYPFIALNLLFSTQAAYAAPIIMMSNNRAAERDRAKAEHDYQVNAKTLAIIQRLAKHFDVRLDELEEEMDSNLS